MHIRCLIECLNDIVVLNWSQVSPNFKVFIYLTIFWSKIDLRSWVYYTLHMLHSIGKHLGTHLGTHSCISCYTYICIHTNTHLHNDLISFKMSCFPMHLCYCLMKFVSNFWLGFVAFDLGASVLAPCGILSCI